LRKTALEVNFRKYFKHINKGLSFKVCLVLGGLATFITLANLSFISAIKYHLKVLSRLI